MDNPKLYTGIGLFGRTLKELSIRGTSTDYFSLTALLIVVPALTHLTVKIHHIYRYMGSEYEEPINKANQQNSQTSNDNNNNYNLVFLSLDTEFNYDFEIQPVLQRCPQLKYLVISNYGVHMKILPTDFKHVLEICPSIRYIHWGEQIDERNSDNEWLTKSRRRDANNETNNDREKREVNHLRQVEVYTEDEEQHVSILTTSLQQPSLLEHLHLSAYLNIDLYKVWNSFTQRNINLLSRPSQLKLLELMGYYVPNRIENRVFLEDFFKYFQHIERLKIMFIVIPIHPLVGERELRVQWLKL